jgi:hypothetical protein
VGHETALLSISFAPGVVRLGRGDDPNTREDCRPSETPYGFSDTDEVMSVFRKARLVWLGLQTASSDVATPRGFEPLLHHKGTD